MPGIIKYGLDCSCTLDLPPDALIADCAGPVGMDVVDVAGEVAAALASPIAFPPLCQATVPGDQVAVVVGEGVPQLDRILAAVLDDLLGRSDPAAIRVLCADPYQAVEEDALRAQLSSRARERVTVAQHDARDRDSWAYVAATKDALPIYLNRAIVDADLVVPIGCLRSDAAPDYLGVHSPLYPRFADEAARKRFRNPTAIPGRQLQARQRREVDEVGWLLGVQFTVQVVPGGDDSVLHVLAGQADEVAARGRELCETALHCAVPRQAGLVVATIEGGTRHQTWNNVARALAAASRVASDEGAIALCCDLAVEPGPALWCAAQTESTEEALRTIHRERAVDALPAAWLLHVLADHPVFLLSRLDEQTVEDLGMAYLADADDLARLSQQFHSCIALRGAHHLVPRVDATAAADVMR